MKKKLFIGALAFVLCLGLVGCGKSDDIVDDITDNNVENTSNSSTGTSDDIKLYSDNTKYVFEMGNIKYVFYYSGDEITAYHTYLDYGDANTATLTNNILKAEDLENVDKHYVKGKYIVFEYNKSEYEDLKTSDLRTVYAYMKEVKE